MKNKKMIALGMVAAVTMATVAPVYAAENAMTGGGSTTVTYTPGESTGGDGDGNLASWTVDYPVKITLDDSMLDTVGTSAPAHSRDVNFAAYNTGTKEAYTGGATIKVSLEGLGANGATDGSIKMLDTNNQTTDGVVMKLWDKTNSKNVATDVKTEFAQLSSTTTEATLNAYLFNNANAKSDMTYTQKLTWVFESAKY